MTLSLVILDNTSLIVKVGVSTISPSLHLNISNVSSSVKGVSWSDCSKYKCRSTLLRPVFD
ncbi:hypothetical protein [Moraxella lacunata]|uniref:hypothetical protein n=1 Tax=Moraxella lacunata TaxID=477 RepID=UPI003EE261DC